VLAAPACACKARIVVVEEASGATLPAPRGVRRTAPVCTPVAVADEWAGGDAMKIATRPTDNVSAEGRRAGFTSPTNIVS